MIAALPRRILERMRVMRTAAGFFVLGGAMIGAWAAPAPARAPGSAMPQATALPSPCPQTWCRTLLAPGVVWSYRTMGLPSGVPRVNVAEVDPAGIVTEEGSVTWLVEADKSIVMLLVGAELMVTVPVVEHEAVTVLGERVTDETVCAKAQTVPTANPTQTNANLMKP